MKYKRFKQIKENRQKIALERIEILKEMIKKKPEFTERYKELIKKIANKYRLKIDF
jgi:RNase P subunit RPR2